MSLAALVYALTQLLPSPATKETFRAGKAQVVTDPKPRRVTAADRRQIDRLLNRFVPAGVARKDPAASWELVTASMRSGISHAEWLRGGLPVQEFPAQGHNFSSAWTVKESYANDVIAELILKPDARHRALASLAFSVEVKKLRGHWLVDSFYPIASFPSAQGVKKGEHELGPADYTGGTSSAASDSSPLGGGWLLAPFALLSLGLLVPLGLFVAHKRRERRAFVEFRGQVGKKELPDLSGRIPRD